MRRQIGMVFQSFNLYPHMTAVANVTLALRRVLKRDRITAEAIAIKALDQVGLKEKASAVSSRAIWWPTAACCDRAGNRT